MGAMCSKISTWECMGSDCWTKHKKFLETTISLIWYIGQKFLVYWFWHHIHNLLSKVESWNAIYSLWKNQSWAFDLLNFSLYPHLQNLIQDIPIARTAHFPDAYLWPYNKGTCSVKSASHFLYNQYQVPWNTTLWNWL